MSSGVGKDIESAIQNAAEAALTQVVGSFIDTNKLIEKRKEIKNGIKTQSKKVSSKVSQYSQGSIQSLDIIDVEEKEGLTYVTVKVSVRIEDFEKYIKKIVSAEKKVKKGLLSKIKIKKKQSKNLSDIFIDILSDLESFQVMSIEINGDIEPVEDQEFINALSRDKEIRHISNLLRSNQGTLIRIPVRSKIKSEFLKNYINTLDEIASSRFIGKKTRDWKVRRQTNNYVVLISDFLFHDWYDNSDGIYVGAMRPKGSNWMAMDLYRMHLKKSEIRKVRLYSFDERISADLCKRMMDREKEKRGVKKLGFKARVSTPSISLKYLDQNGSVIRDEVLEPTRTYGRTPVPYNTTSEYSFVYFTNGEDSSWHGHPYAAVVQQIFWNLRHCSTVVDTVQDYEIISLVSDELLSDTAKIEVSFIK